MSARVWFEPHPDDEWYDELVVRCVERWKESELSGDEYRFSYVLEFRRKGHTLVERGYSRWPWALAHVPADALNDYPAGADDDHDDAPVITNRWDFCFQPGCPDLAEREFRILKLYSRQGEERAMTPGDDYRFRFCARHAQHRGDCGLLDSDANLVEVPFGADANARPT